MFSYRHAFHAGNHADVLKHTVLIATLQYLLEKDAALTVLDTHAGVGLYRLDGDYARTSGEAGDGILRLTMRGAGMAAAAGAAGAASAPTLAPVMRRLRYRFPTRRRARASSRCSGRRLNTPPVRA